MGRGVHRGFITYEELNKSLGKEIYHKKNLAQAFIHILDDKIVLVEKKSDFKVLRKKIQVLKKKVNLQRKVMIQLECILEKWVELNYSQERRNCNSQRIEAGKDVMLNALSQSPITAQQFFEWNIKLQSDEILVREIIDIDTNYTEDEDTGTSVKQKKVKTMTLKKILKKILKLVMMSSILL